MIIAAGQNPMDQCRSRSRKWIRSTRSWRPAIQRERNHRRSFPKPRNLTEEGQGHWPRCRRISGKSGTWGRTTWSRGWRTRRRSDSCWCRGSDRRWRRAPRTQRAAPIRRRKWERSPSALPSRTASAKTRGQRKHQEKRNWHFAERLERDEARKSDKGGRAGTDGFGLADELSDGLGGLGKDGGGVDAVEADVGGEDEARHLLSFLAARLRKWGGCLLESISSGKCAWGVGGCVGCSGTWRTVSRWFLWWGITMPHQITRILTIRTG